jgi:2-keto-4-pentenoate hydratase/2-oxohepta-3-ene-1,7-dioic acid hydratase in catechol pathway
MKFLSYLDQASQRLGVLLNETTVVDLTAALDTASGQLRFVPRDVGGLIELGEDGLTAVREILAGTPAGQLRTRPLAGLQLQAPLRPKKNVFCVGRNYRAHIIEGNLARGRPANQFPEAIEFFTKPPTAIIGSGAAIHRHAALTDSLDYEAELAIVIGRQGRDIPRSEALEYVYGYTIVNDVTARDLQRKHGQWFKGKGLDTSCPMGPVVVHRSAIANPNALDISLTVNGEQRQSDNTSSMIFSVEAIIEQLSRGMTLEAGDVISTGTPKGVGYARQPPACLNAGDVVSATVEGIGTLTNVVAE